MNGRYLTLFCFLLLVACSLLPAVAAGQFTVQSKLVGAGAAGPA